MEIDLSQFHQDFFEESLELLAGMEKALLELNLALPLDAEQINLIFRAAHSIKGSAATYGFTTITEFTHILESFLHKVRNGSHVLTQPEIMLLLKSVDCVRQLIAAQQQKKPVNASTTQEIKDAILKLQNTAEPAPETPPSSEKSVAQEGVIKKNKIMSTTVRVATKKIDILINMMGELIIIHSALEQLCKDFSINQLSKLHEIEAQLGLNCQELQSQVLRIRMLPISSVFNQLPRLVRDCANQLSKQVDLKIKGGETEIDKSMLEKIIDPLQHMLRNAVDHGIETPSNRIAAGKSPIGVIQVNASQQHGNIIISISDDGAGLSKERIRAKALTNGLITEQDILTDTQLYELLFKPGFTTAPKVTAISGRGVGMDVVLQSIQSLSGSIAIQSIEGKGSTFTIRLPLTLAIMDCQLTKVGEQIYIVPLSTIVEIFQIEPDRVQNLEGEKLYHWRDKYIAILNLKEILQPPSAQTPPLNQFLIVVEVHNTFVGLLIDELLGQQQVFIKSLEKNYQLIDGVMGATILGDGSIGFIIDPNRLCNSVSKKEVIPAKVNEDENLHESKAPDEILQVLSFKLADHEYAIDMLDIMEIHSWIEPVPLPRATAYIKGVINLRGEIVPVIDLRACFNLPSVVSTLLTPVLVLKIRDSERFRLAGVVVDAISDIYNLTYAEINAIPDNDGSVVHHLMMGLLTVNNKMIALLDINNLLSSTITA